MMETAQHAIPRLLTIQRMRALAAILVIGVHAGRLELRAFPTTWLHPIQSFGNAGVDLFFIISGFIMISTTWDDFGKQNSSLAFLIRRVVRIYPVYWVVMAAYLILDRVFPAVLHIDDASASSVIKSLLLVPQQHYPTLVVAWTLICEMFFYLFFALLLLLPRRYGKVMFLAWVGISIAGGILIHTESPILAQLLSPFNIEFALGVSVGYLIKTGRMISPAVTLGIGFAGLAAAFIYLLPLDDVPSTWFRVICLGGPFALITYGTICREIRAGGTRSSDWLTRVGDASYSMYLWHGFLLAGFTAVVVRFHPHGFIWHVLFIVGMYAFTIFASVILYRVIERPITRRLHRFVQSSKPSISPPPSPALRAGLR